MVKPVNAFKEALDTINIPVNDGERNRGNNTLLASELEPSVSTEVLTLERSGELPSTT
jgi:hypothetical protein